MKDQLADFEISKKLKELGFKEQCLFMYNGGFDGKKFDLDIIDLENVDFNKPLEDDDTYTNWATHQISAPYYQQIKKWLWEKYKIVIQVGNVSSHVEGYNEYEFETTIEDGDGQSIDYIDSFDSPITAEIDGIKKTVEYLHKNEKGS